MAIFSFFRPFCLLVCLLVLAGGSSAVAGDHIRYIPASKLAKIITKAHIIDTRSRLEYNMLHIRGAVHIPVGTMMKEDLERVVARDPLLPLVFYCNGYL